MDPEILSLCESSLANLSHLGCLVDNATPDFSMAGLWRRWVVLRQWLVAGTRYADYQNLDKRAQLKPELIWEIEHGLRVSALDIYQASELRSAWLRAMLKLFDKFDFLVLPSAQVFPFADDLHAHRQALDTKPHWHTHCGQARHSRA